MQLRKFIKLKEIKDIYWLYKIISKKNKIRLLKLIFLMITCAISEVIAVSSVVPFLGLLINPEAIQTFPIINYFLNNFSIQNPIIVSGFILIFANIITPFLRLYNLKKSGLITSLIGTELSYLLYKVNINQPYSEYIKFNSSTLISAITTDIGRVVQILSNINKMITGIFISFLIIINLLIINKSIAISSLMIFSSCYFIIGIITKKRLLRNSKIVSENSIKIVKLIQDIFGSIREVILYQYQYISLEDFKNVDKPMRKYGAENIFIASFPKYILESVGLVFITIFAIYLSINGLENDKVLPILGLFAISAQKLLPAFQQIYVGWSTVKGYQASLVRVKSLILKKIIKSNKFQTKKKFLFKNRILFKNIYFKYVNKKQDVFSDLNFQINKGEKIGFVGSTGAGKSTLINMIMGFLSPIRGEIFIDDVIVSGDNQINNLKEWQKLVAYVPQNIYLKDSSFVNNIAFGVDEKNIDFKRIISVSEKAKIKDFIEHTENGFYSRVGERGILLSGGQAQRIALARALYRNSEILILDEATSALDMKTEKEIINSIFNLDNNLTLIMISHRLSTLSYCDRIFLINNCNIEEISYENLIRRNTYK